MAVPRCSTTVSACNSRKTTTAPSPAWNNTRRNAPMADHMTFGWWRWCRTAVTAKVAMRTVTTAAATRCEYSITTV